MEKYANSARKKHFSTFNNPKDCLEKDGNRWVEFYNFIEIDCKYCTFTIIDLYYAAAIRYMNKHQVANGTFSFQLQPVKTRVRERVIVCSSMCGEYQSMSMIKRKM